MAKMIPAHIVDDKTSLAERKIFSLLKEDLDTEGWTVLHSLELARRERENRTGK